jgi:branched-chain amino acid transport system substrate-binding protein
VVVMGPYATTGVLAAMGVAQRHQKMLIHNSFGTPHLAKYHTWKGARD